LLQNRVAPIDTAAKVREHQAAQAVPGSGVLTNYVKLYRVCDKPTTAA
jgi:hypothetical protein